MLKYWISAVSLAFSLSIAQTAPARQESKPAAEKPSGEAKQKERETVVTKHAIKLGDETLRYTATAGEIPLKNDKGETEAHVFYMSYTRDDVKDLSKRPLMFSFNGGPGSSSVWLHLGALGPKRVEFPDDAEIPKPPYRLLDNDSTWLTATDLVFIDPVGTGYSRASKGELNAKFHGVKGDISSIGDFIRLYLTRNDRWTSPLYLVGESYGTMRAAGLSNDLFEKGIALNGIVLVSTVLDFQTLVDRHGNDLGYALFLPSLTATAWYHKKLLEIDTTDLNATLAEVEHWAETDYLEALEKGDRLTVRERAKVIDQLSRYTGLSKGYIDLSDLRVNQDAFAKELLRDRKRTVGRLDSRFQGIDASATGLRTEFDPGMAAVQPAFTAMFNQYVRADLNYKTDETYHISGDVGRWDWGLSGQGFAETSTALRDALSKNPHMKILVAAGRYDLATPYHAVNYSLSHMRLDPSVRKNFRVKTYDAGHMMYIHGPSRNALAKDVEVFLKESRNTADGPR